jgi:hypothetical protein
VGWLDLSDGTPLFVTPERVIGESGTDGRVVLQGCEYPTQAFASSGTLEQWQRRVFENCKGHPFLSFPIYAAFAAPLMKLVNLDSGGFHFYGASSKGKTTLLQAASSVWGNGGDPAVSLDALTGRWSSTANAFEATAVTHNDLLLPLDELGTCDVQDAGKVTYNLFGGRGKVRLTKDSDLRKTRSWRTLGLSSGEISLREKIREVSGRPAHTGQLIRLADVPIPTAGVLDELIISGDSRSAINAIKEACGRYYGTAGPAFIERLLKSQADELEPGERLTAARLARSITDRLKQTERRLCEGLNVETHHERVVRRMALVALAGCLAVELDVLPSIPEATIIHAVSAIRDAWLHDDENMPADVRGINTVRSTILLHDDRFRQAKDDSENVHGRIGYRIVEPGTTQMLYLFERSSFDQICRDARCDPKTVLEALKQRNLLFMNDHRVSSRHQIAGIGRAWFIAIRARIVERE